MAVALPAGKLRNLLILADETGRFRMMAIDPRTSLQRSAVGGRGAMASNHKLTGVLKGRTITSTQSRGNELRIGFDDGSTMTVETGGAVSSAATGGTVKAVRQQDTRLSLDLEDGGMWEIQMAEPTASVMVRDKEHTLDPLRALRFRCLYNRLTIASRFTSRVPARSKATPASSSSPRYRAACSAVPDMAW